MKKVIIGDFVEYNSTSSKLGNYHYCNCFIKDGYEALWISNAFNGLIYLKDKSDYRFKKSISAPERHYLDANIYGFAPYAWRLYGNYPLCRKGKLLEHFEKYIQPDIVWSLQKLDFYETDILWISNPKMYWLTNVVRYEKLVYRIADDYSQFKEFPDISSIDEMLIRKADKVVVSASTLAEHVGKRGKAPLLLSNGVEFEHFTQKTGCPEEYNHSKRKRLVYVGALKYWFDTELIAKLARQVDADIYLIGKVETDLSSLVALPNIHILGARAYEVLPGYLQHAQAALIPFVKNATTDSISPIKLYEYCSAGVAVVSTDLAETARLQAPIWLAKDHTAFIDGVKYYLSQDYDHIPLIEFGRKNSWYSRYQTVKNKLYDY